MELIVAAKCDVQPGCDVQPAFDGSLHARTVTGEFPHRASLSVFFGAVVLLERANIAHLRCESICDVGDRTLLHKP